MLSRLFCELVGLIAHESFALIIKGIECAAARRRRPEVLRFLSFCGTMSGERGMKLATGGAFKAGGIWWPLLLNSARAIGRGDRD